jgi:hypothetical protein
MSGGGADRPPSKNPPTRLVRGFFGGLGGDLLGLDPLHRGS